jgi:hypothetical protein
MLIYSMFIIKQFNTNSLFLNIYILHNIYSNNCTIPKDNTNDNNLLIYCSYMTLIYGGVSYIKKLLSFYCFYCSSVVGINIVN